jgi:predicted DNA-binding antitoxin AbrB/MazE fold protein
MKQIVDAVYENGVFRPLSPLDLPSGERVRVEIDVKPQVDVNAIVSQFREVYAGLTPDEIAELEAVILDRSSFSRPERAS